MTDNNPVTLTIASGKGGVGKTCISANLAYVFSKFGRTLLVDLDMQNQGCTSLLAKSEDIIADSIFSILSDETNNNITTHRLRDNLNFLPAISFESPPTQVQILDVLHSASMSEALTRFVASVSTLYDYIIFDCHGGIDELSRAAFFHSTETLVVTEPDGVTFSGTLELLRSFGAQFTNDGKLIGFHRKEDIKKPEASRKTNMRIIVNRLRGFLSFRSLERLYAPYFKLNNNSMGPSLIYLPTEDLLSESFGEVPFYVELLPDSIFARKLYYITFLILRDRVSEVRNSSLLSKMNKKRDRRKIQQIVTGLGDRLKKLLMRTTMVAGLAMVLVFAVAIIITLFSSNNPEVNGIPNLYFLLIAVAMAVSFSYFTRALRGVDRLYRQRHKFDKAAKRLNLLWMEGFGQARSALLIALRAGLWFAITFTMLFSITGYAGIIMVLFFPESLN